jgi:hypothetical protein
MTLAAAKRHLRQLVRRTAVRLVLAALVLLALLLLGGALVLQGPDEPPPPPRIELGDIRIEPIDPALLGTLLDRTTFANAW